ncbi:MAG: sensor histidine kinase [Chloroflexi bacterium]|nr:sensor histidine kinase [Chloroflexota bacterium]
MNATASEPSYADFDDYRHNQRIVVILRWYLLFGWAAVNHWAAPWNQSLLYVDLIALALVVLNARLHFKLRRGEPVGRTTAVVMSLFDVIAITAGIAITNRFTNTFFIMYYPALVGLALVTASRSVSLLFVTVVAGAYASISIFMAPGLVIANGDDRRLVARVFVMYILVFLANLIIRAERTKRAEAVEAERARASENLELTKASQQEQLRAAEQRFRIRREIHDGLAQSLYGLSLNIESIAAQAESSGAVDIGGRLAKLIPVARNALLETRHYMLDLSPMLSEQGDIRSALENLAAEFHNISDIEVDLNITNLNIDGEQVADPGDAREQISLEPEVATQICRIIQEALANVLRHSGASKVTVNMEHRPTGITVSIEDNGKGFDSANVSGGFGLGHIASRAEELGGKFEVITSDGAGTRILIELPPQPPQKEVTAK